MVHRGPSKILTYLVDSIVEDLGLLGVSGLPVLVSALPGSVLALELILALGEEGLGLRGHIPLLLGQTQLLAGSIDVLDTSLTVTSVGTSDLINTLADDGLADDELGLAVVVGLGVSHSLVNGGDVVAVDLDHLPA